MLTVEMAEGRGWALSQQPVVPGSGVTTLSGLGRDRFHHQASQSLTPGLWAQSLGPHTFIPSSPLSVVTEINKGCQIQD